MKPADYPREPAELWEHFYQISQIPRPSKEEAAIRQYVIELAHSRNLRWQSDDVGNIVVYVPGTAGREQQSPVIIQNHLDMVTVKTQDKAHDFSRDALSLQVKDGWLSADRTTLGADNGLGCAAAMALISDVSVAHPPLELLFTVDEETGLGGALELDASMLSGSTMLNLDTEDWHELYIGCAGGEVWTFEREFVLGPARDLVFFEVELKGLAGGHSGIQIHQQLGNAAKLLVDFMQAVPGLRLAELDVGLAHNVIPREGSARFACSRDRASELDAVLDRARARWLSYLPAADQALELNLHTQQASAVLSEADSMLVLDLLAVFPHGAQAYNLEQPADLVDLSVNLAKVQLQGSSLFIESSLRNFNPEQAVTLQHTMESVARLGGLNASRSGGYPGWQPDFTSPLLARGKALHRRMFGSEPAVKAIHAGLECGILKSKKPDVDILSFGPTIRGAHSPSERLEIDTVAPFWDFLCALLAEL